MAFTIRVDGKPVRLPDRLPLLPLRDVVIYPGTAVPLFIGRPASVAGITKALASRKLLLAVAQRRPEVSEPRVGDLYGTGVVVRVQQALRLPDGTMRILVEGLARAGLRRLRPAQDHLEAQITPLEEEVPPGLGTISLLRGVQAIFREYARLNRRIPEEARASEALGDEPLFATYQMASHLLLKVSSRQDLLEAPDVAQRLKLLRSYLVAELEVAKLEQKIETRAQTRQGRSAEAYGTKKGSPNEVFENGDELEELEAAIKAARMPSAVTEKAHKELERLARMPFLSPEATVSRTYIDWMLALPWHRRTRDRIPLEEAEAVLNGDHYGLHKIKERILEHIAVIRLSKEVKGPILCLVGPPGVGKTSLGRSIARALNRKFVRMSLGGVRDEAEIRGHRRTYIGALPGRILQAMRRAGTINPVILLDEVDKLGVDYRGDPAAALLEVLDPEQNSSFNDHYLEMDYDLSKVLFVTTANTASGIPPALRDRMEVIYLPGYLETEKRIIAERFLLPRQRAANGLGAQDLIIGPEAIGRIILEYTREAGVRNLERELASICRKVARRKASGSWEGPQTFAPDMLETFLGVPRFAESPLDQRDRVGLATGLAWTEAGGTCLQIEVGILPGRGKLILTGKLGSVMRESAQTAFSYVRSRTEVLGLDPHFHRHVDIHVHIPEGEVPKDGPSAGVTIALSMVSALTHTPTRPSVALTGELTLRGLVLPVGGLTEKAVAALRAGVRTLLIPAGNKRHIAEIPEEARAALRIVTVNNMDQVLRHGLGKRPKPVQEFEVGRPQRIRAIAA